MAVPPPSFHPCLCGSHSPFVMLSIILNFKDGLKLYMPCCVDRQCVRVTVQTRNSRAVTVGISFISVFHQGACCVAADTVPGVEAQYDVWTPALRPHFLRKCSKFTSCCKPP